MPNLNFNQLVSIFLVVLGVFMASTAQLTDLFGAIAAKYIVSLSGLLVSILSGILGVLTGQASQVKAVQAMPGVESIVVNAQANKTLAALAVDPAQAKVDVLPAAKTVVEATAKAA